MKRNNMKKIKFFTSTIALFVFSSHADAHLITSGMGPVYDGIGHLLLTPEDLIPVLAIALYAGLRGAVVGRRLMFILPLSWFVGGVIGSTANISIFFPIEAIAFVIFGGLVATDLCLPAETITGLIAFLGIVYGFLNGVALKDSTGTLGLIGIVTMLFLIVSLVSAFVVSLKKSWSRIAVRVAGSWIAATGLLMLGWSLRVK